MKRTKGKGILDNLTNGYNKTISSVQNTAQKVQDYGNNTVKSVENYGNTVINGRNDYPPNVRKILQDNSENVVSSITIGRTPVSSAITSALNVVSGGNWSKQMKEQPYDKLFHLFIFVKLNDGSTIRVEKNAVISMIVNPSIEGETKEMSVSIPQGLLFGDMMEKTKQAMGSNMFSYASKGNNCQNFIMAILDANNIGNADDRAFVIQDTTQLFGNDSFLRKTANTVTDIGGRADVLMNGAGLHKGALTKMLKAYNLKNNKKWSMSHYAVFIVHHPDHFSELAVKRARFYVNTVMGHECKCLKN